jgi:hypothetical protein
MTTFNAVVADVRGQSNHVDALVALIEGLKKQVMEVLPGATPQQAGQIDAIFQAVQNNPLAIWEAIQEGGGKVETKGRKK